MRTQSTNNALVALIILLILVVAGMGYYTYDFHNKVTEREAQLESKREMIAQQLEDEIIKYDALLNERNGLKEQLSGAHDRLQELQKSLAKADITQSSLRNLQIEVRRLQQEREFFLNQNDSLELETRRLSQLQLRTQEALDKANKSQDSIKNSNTALERKLKEGARLTGSNLIARGVIQRNSGKFINTIRASRTEMLQVCYTINENSLAAVSDETFYVQVRHTDGPMIGLGRTELWSNGTLVPYNTVTEVPYKGTSYAVCDLVLPLEKLEPGDYSVQVFHNEAVFLETKVTLK